MQNKYVPATLNLKRQYLATIVRVQYLCHVGILKILRSNQCKNVRHTSHLDNAEGPISYIVRIILLLFIFILDIFVNVIPLYILTASDT